MARLIILTGLSGSGKTSISHELVKDPHIKQVVTTTTRPRRPNEVDEVDYHFVTESGFRRMQEAGELLEHAEVYDHLYGTSRDALQVIFDAGKDALLVVDVQGALWWKENYKGEQLTLFIAPPSKEAMIDRLKARGESAEVFERRVCAAIKEYFFYNSFDHLIINKDFDEAVAVVKQLVR